MLISLSSPRSPPFYGRVIRARFRTVGKPCLSVLLSSCCFRRSHRPPASVDNSHLRCLIYAALGGYSRLIGGTHSFVFYVSVGVTPLARTSFGNRFDLRAQVTVWLCCFFIFLLFLLFFSISVKRAVYRHLALFGILCYYPLFSSRHHVSSLSFFFTHTHTYTHAHTLSFSPHFFPRSFTFSLVVLEGVVVRSPIVLLHREFTTRYLISHSLFPFFPLAFIHIIYLYR